MLLLRSMRMRRHRARCAREVTAHVLAAPMLASPAFVVLARAPRREGVPCRAAQPVPRPCSSSSDAQLDAMDATRPGRRARPLRCRCSAPVHAGRALQEEEQESVSSWSPCSTSALPLLWRTRAASSKRRSRTSCLLDGGKLALAGQVQDCNRIEPEGKELACS